MSRQVLFVVSQSRRASRDFNKAGGQHSHTAVRLLLEPFIGGHAQGHLADLAAETTFVPILEREGERKRVLDIVLKNNRYDH